MRSTRFSPEKLRPYIGLIAGVVSVIIFLVLRLMPEVTEQVYGRTIYPVFRWLFDFSLGWLPFAAAYLLPFLIIGLFVFTAVKKNTLGNWLRTAGNALGWIVTMFYFFWGFNYARPSLSDRIPDTSETISDKAMVALAQSTVSNLNALRTNSLITSIPEDDKLNDLLRTAVAESLANYNINLKTNCLVRPMSPPGILRKFGITGIYMPLTGEALLEKSHPQPEKIFVMAHELSHSFGVTDEGEANLVAYLSCITHPNEVIRYAGHLSMWEYVMWELHRRQIQADFELEPIVQEDLERLKEERKRFKEWVPELGDMVNDTYLKAQGVEAGTASYSTLPELYIRHAPN